MGELDEHAGRGLLHPGDPRRPGSPTRPPARSYRRCRCRPRSPRTASAATRASSTPARATRPVQRSKRRSPRSSRRTTAWRSPAASPPRTTSCGCCDQGQRTLLGNDAYGGTFRLISKVWGPLGFPWSAVDLTDLDALRRGLARRRRDGVARNADQPIAHLLRHRGDRLDRATITDALVVVDNTFATPYLQQPLTLGADIVVHSADEVPRRAQRRGRRLHRRRRRRAGRTAPIHPERGGRDPRRRSTAISCSAG